METNQRGGPEVVQGRVGDTLDLGGSGGISEGWSCSRYSRYLNNVVLVKRS